ncbi:MAG: sigma-70 family RNA polymerase sigma factor, partial [Clostridia bacterium]|nr:sigma-70 family RNA polymerase sigma factor [Clostridia bacterium]
MDKVDMRFRRAKDGDTEALAALCAENAGLVRHVCARFKSRGEDMEDLMQIGTIGLISAIHKFDASYGTRFSTYAVPLILGEIRRYFRDNNLIKVSRGVKRCGQEIAKATETFLYSHGRSPTVSELAQLLGISQEEVTEGICATSPVFSVSAGEEGEGCLAETLAAPESDVSISTQMDLRAAVTSLPPRERAIVFLRYAKEKSQSEIGKKLGISQVQVSRLE